MKYMISHPRLGAFTLIELLVVIAIIAIWRACCRPRWRRRNRRRRASCMNNTRQLMLNFLYQGDNDTSFEFVSRWEAQNPTWPRSRRPPVVVGWIGTSQHNTNVLYLTDERYSKLAKYFGNTKNIMKCPADKFLSGVQRKGWASASAAFRQYRHRGQCRNGSGEASTST
jgi:prepilin-type N-terminal cleavage/methylation domain-containing protein